MTEQDFQNDPVQNHQMHLHAAAAAAAQQHLLDSAKLPLSPSATSTASSSSSNYTPSNGSSNAAAAAAAAAIALLAEQRNVGNMLSHKDLAQMSQDVKNFKMDHHFNTIANVASQLQHHLYKQERHDGENLLMEAGKKGKSGQHRSRRPPPPPIRTNESSLHDDDDDCDDDDDDDCHSDEYNEDDDDQRHSLNLCMNQRKRNGVLIKGNSLSPSPRGTSCSEETHSPLKSSSYSSKKNSRSSQSDMHEEHDRSLTPNSSRSISPKSSSYRGGDENNTTITSPYTSVDASLLSQMQNASGLASGFPASNAPGLNNDALNNLSAAMTANAAANLPITSTVATILATRKRRNERDSNERNKKIKPVPDEKKDDQYWERRRKNNEAAKRSRDLRRQKEDEIAVRAAFLEQENLKLRAQVTILKAELSKLHFMIYNR
jgi:hypothetical protein